MTIPIAEPLLGSPEESAVLECLRSGWISSKGANIPQFEQEFSAFCQAKFGVSTSNGTTALHLVIAALGIGPGDEVIVPTLTFAASANTVHHAGASPILVDSEPTTWCIDPSKVEAAITARTKAIMPVHLYGHPADLRAIGEIAERHGIPIIEDAAEAHGAEIDGRRVGGLGLAGCFSFFGNKIFTTGEGGMVVTNDEALAARMRLLRDHGMDPSRRYWHTEIGYNYRLTNIQAAIGLAQLSRAEAILRRKQEIADRYDSLLTGVEGIHLPPRTSWARNVFWMYSILVVDPDRHDREQVRDFLGQRGIETRPFFYPLHTMPPYRSEGSFPVAESLSCRGINLPSSVTLRDEDIVRVAETVVEAMRS